MENLEHKYNIIMVDEDFIGNAKNLKGYFIEALTYSLQQDITSEEKVNNIEMTLDILKDLERTCYEPTVVRVCYNPMGKYFISENGLER